MKRVLLLFALLVWRMTLIAQDCANAVQSGWAYEMSAAEYFGVILDDYKRRQTISLEEMLAKGKSITQSELRAMEAKEYAERQKRKRAVLETSVEPDNTTDILEISFKRDSEKLYMEGFWMRLGFRTSEILEHRYYEIEFSDREVVKHIEPFATDYDHNDVFLFLEGKMEVLQFDERGAPAATKTIYGDTILLQMMLKVPIKKITRYNACDVRFLDFLPFCESDEPRLGLSIEVENYSNEIMTHLRCLYGSKK